MSRQNWPGRPFVSSSVCIQVRAPGVKWHAEFGKISMVIKYYYKAGKILHKFSIQTP